MFVCTVIATGKIGLADIGNARVRTTLPGRQISGVVLVLHTPIIKYIFEIHLV